MKKILFIFLFICLIFAANSCKRKDTGGDEGGNEKENPVVAEINLLEKSVKLNLGETYQVKVEVKNATGSFTYTIEDPTIVSVNDGTVTALKAGKTNVKISVECNDEAKTKKDLTLSVEVVDNRVYNITYSSSTAGFSKASETIKPGETKALGTAPSIDGYEFVGWSLTDSLNSTFITELSNVENDVTVYALYKPLSHTITYASNIEEFSKKADTVEHGKNFKLGTAPSITGYTFRGWSLTLELKIVSELKNVISDMTVYAIYALKKYTITFNLDGGTYTGANTVEHGKTLQLGKPTRDGYKFLGWSLEKDSTEYITEIVGSSNLTVYANWKEVIVYPDGVYPISYDLDGGSWEVIHYTPAEIGELFMADFNESCGRSVAAADLDCSNIESSWFADMMKRESYRTKWTWLLDAIWTLAKAEDSWKASNANWDDGSTKGFYLANLNGYFTSTQHKDAYLGPISQNYADPDVSNVITAAGPAKSENTGPATYKKGEGVASLPTPVRSEYVFVHWEDAEGNVVTSISTTQEGEIELKAIWEHETIAENIEFTNVPADGMKLYSTLQLTWVVTPNDAVNKNVQFYVLTPEIVNVTEGGLVKAKSVGEAKIRIRLESNAEYESVLTISVWNGNYFDVSYETNSYVDIDDTIKLNAAYVDKAQNRKDVTWESLNTDIATIDANGVVTGKSAGVATIRATVSTNGSFTFDFFVTVLPTELSDALKFVIDNHHSNAQTTYDLGIGDGNPEYYYDVVGGVNNLIFDKFKVDRRYYDQLPEGTKNYGKMSSVEFITVHYTGNMKYSADADNNCDYFNELSYQASIHFVTGRTNLTDLTHQSSGYNADAYYAFAGLNELYGGWHATNKDDCVWDDASLNVEAGDPATPLISISSNNKYTINGRETSISIPTPPDGYTVNGNVLTVEGKQYSVFNQYGIRAKVVDGKYYIARTHWGTQRSPRAICTCGGNKNSIGIESCVDKGSDLEHTWHVTAQLVASLLVKYNLGFDRVVGHHFFSGKDCPQPFLERDMKLWYEFMDMVKAEYELLTTYKDAEISAAVVSGDGILRKNGLLVQNADAHSVTYEVTVKVGDKTEKITLATLVESYFKFNGTRKQESLQIEGFEII